MIKALLNRIIARFQTKLEIGSAEANALVLADIAVQGDDGTTERLVKHTAYPLRNGRARDRSYVVDLFSEVGLAPSEAIYRGGIIGEHDAVIAGDDFNILTNSLRDTLAQVGWEYDGWECAILRDK